VQCAEAFTDIWRANPAINIFRSFASDLEVESNLGNSWVQWKNRFEVIIANLKKKIFNTVK
jgi:hypothetical protein